MRGTISTPPVEMYGIASVVLPYNVYTTNTGCSVMRKPVAKTQVSRKARTHCQPRQQGTGTGIDTTFIVPRSKSQNDELLRVRIIPICCLW